MVANPPINHTAIAAYLEDLAKNGGVTTYGAIRVTSRSDTDYHIYFSMTEIESMIEPNCILNKFVWESVAFIQ